MTSSGWPLLPLWHGAPLGADAAREVSCEPMARPRSALTKLILSLPPGLSAKEVITQVRAKGMRATESNVYRVRRMFRPGSETQTRPSATPSVAPVRTASLSRAEDLLRALGAEVGLARAVDILVAERARVRSLVRR
jgi:hypothetical protein